MMIALLKYWKAGLIVVLLGVAGVAWHARDAALVEKGRAEERVRELTTALRLDSLTAHRRDSVVRVDTLRYVRWTTKLDTVRKTLRITDTVSVREYITVADSTIKSCRESVTALSLSCAAKDTIIAHQRALLSVRVEQPPRASVAQRVLWGLGGLAVGYTAGRIVP